MAKPTIEEIRVKLASQGARWTPGITSVSELPEHRQNRRLGLEINTAEMARVRSAINASRPQRASFAPEVDWRERNGKKWMTPVRDQGECGSCVAFGTIAALESRARIIYNRPDWDVSLSVADLFFCGAGRKCNEGWWPSFALTYAQSRGVPDERCFPYQDHDMDCNSCANRPDRLMTVTSWEEMPEIERRKEFLDQHGPMVACMAVYRDFFSYRSGVYRHVAGDLAGYHCVCCVGYSEREGCWICKNSWGDWGDNGYFKIAYGESGIDTEFAMYGIRGVAGTLKPSDEEGKPDEALADAYFADYALASSKSVFWAHAAGQWRSREVTDSQLASLSAAAQLAGSLKIYYIGDRIERVVAMKQLASLEATSKKK